MNATSLRRGFARIALIASFAALLAAAFYTISTDAGSRQTSRRELFEPAIRTARLNVARRGPAAVELDGGRVLIIGGDNAFGPVKEAELFDKGTDRFILAANSLIARTDLTATRLADGHVLVAGGRHRMTAQRSSEIYSPVANTFARGPHLQRARAGHSATLLEDGKILIAGGEEQGSAEIFDPATSRFTRIAAPMTTARAFHAAVRLPNGNVLLIGGQAPDGSLLHSAEIFEPVKKVFTATENELLGARRQPALRVLRDGKVQVLGGDENGAMEIYNPESGTFTAYGHPSSGARTTAQVLQAQTRATLLRKQPVTGQPPASDVERQTVDRMAELLDRERFSMTEILTGTGISTLIAGGENSDGQALDTAYLLTSSAATVTTDQTDYHPGDTVVISGSFWQAGETVRLTLHRDNDTADTVLETIVDANGDFIQADYVCQDTDLGVTFILTAEGLSSAYVAQTTFTDSPPGIIDPSAQTIPYVQDFSALSHASTTYPTGWQGWRLGNTPSTSFRTTDATANEALRASSTAATTAAGVHNYNGKIGFLATGTADPAVCLAINTLGAADVVLSFDIMTIRNPYNGTSDTKINQVDLQYRVGVSGAFTSLSGSVDGIYQNNTTLQTAAVTTPQNAQAKTFTLPPACNNQPVVQLRWVQREAAGGGARPSFAIDNLSICPGLGSAGPIAGPTSVCAAAAALEYSASAISGATSYAWTVPAGAVITSGQGTTAITVDWGETSGNVTVTPSSSCATGLPGSLAVTVKAAPTATVSGGGSVCAGTSTVISASLTGVGPWAITWSDGFMQTGIVASPAMRTVSPLTTTIYTVTSIADAACAGTSSGSATVTIADTAPPTITLSGTNPMTVECHTPFSDLGASATDDCAGAVAVSTSGSVDSSSPGSYTIVYTASDTAGNLATVTRTVNVVDTTPPTITPPSPVSLETGGGATLCGKVVSDAVLGLASATDTCGTTTINRSGVPAGNLFPVGVTTITYTATDQAGNAATGTQTVTVIDTTQPALTCPSNLVIIAPAGAAAAIATFTVTASDACAVGTPVSSPASGAAFPVGITSVNATVADAAGNSATCSFAVTVKPAVAVTVNAASGQYSDTAMLTAAVSAVSFPGQMLSGSLQFFINGNAAGAPVPIPAGGGTVSQPWLLDYAPGGYNLTAEFTSSNPFYVGSAAGPATLTVTAEDARTVYTGSSFSSTSCATCNTAIVTLSATILDITAAPGDPAHDLTAGDIRKATVTFINRDTNTPINPTPLPVGLVSPAESKTGTVTYNWNVNIGPGDWQSFTIGIMVGNSYSRNDAGENVVVTVSKPLGTNFITGGGHLRLSLSAGEKAGDAGSPCNWGFNVKYNNSGKNLQGNINVIVRRSEAEVTRVYQIKGNSMTSLSTTSATGKAIFNGKVNIQDITDPLNPIAVDGNATLQVTMADNGEPGGDDTIAITVWNKQGGLWFSSRWDGVKTVEQLLSGGNLVVR